MDKNVNKKNMEQKPLISVIVPIYKVEKYLSYCIESILKQSFTDFELLLIDDGSPDDCGVIPYYAQRLNLHSSDEKHESVDLF